MRTKAVVIIFVFALVLAAAATGMVTFYLKRTAAEANTGPLLEPVVVSMKDLSFGKTLEPRDLKVAMFPRESVPKGAVSSIDSLIGQTTKVFLAQDEPVLVSKLSSIGGGLSLLIAPSMRAVSIKVDRVSGVSGFVLPGDRVDVIAIVDKSTSSRDALAKTILQNIEVLAAGEKTEKRGNEPITVQAVTLLVDIEGAEKLALAQAEGKLQLSLRNPNDTELADETKGLSKSELLSGPKEEPAPRPVIVQKPAPPKKEPKIIRPDSLTIIRGREATKQEPAMDIPKPADTSNPTPGE
ncbi:MAG: Flp pilus assembly protein CpaB [Candidatus Zixiibacteriota bacterium]